MSKAFHPLLTAVDHFQGERKSDDRLGKEVLRHQKFMNQEDRQGFRRAGQTRTKVT